MKFTYSAVAVGPVIVALVSKEMFLEMLNAVSILHIIHIATSCLFFEHCSIPKTLLFYKHYCPSTKYINNVNN